MASHDKAHASLIDAGFNWSPGDKGEYSKCTRMGATRLADGTLKGGVWVAWGLTPHLKENDPGTKVPGRSLVELQRVYPWGIFVECRSARGKCKLKWAITIGGWHNDLTEAAKALLGKDLEDLLLNH